uniref:Uncharacterized protein n=1 Tax=Enterobacter cloacae TaxID=550 RepID=A0A0G3B331_ENTCL|nr:hypothetical protein [Enterobacter cloacae]
MISLSPPTICNSALPPTRPLARAAARPERVLSILRLRSKLENIAIRCV